MARRLQAGVILAIAAITGAAVLYLSHRSMSSPETDFATQSLMLATLSDASGKSQMMYQWRGKVLVVNYWATWCVPCRNEIPVLLRIQHKYTSNGVQLVGIALDEVAKVREYAAEMHIDYTLLIGDMEAMAIARNLGNRAGVLPFTAVFDRSGKLAYTHAGTLTEVLLDDVLTPLL